MEQIIPSQSYYRRHNLHPDTVYAERFCFLFKYLKEEEEEAV